MKRAAPLVLALAIVLPTGRLAEAADPPATAVEPPPPAAGATGQTPSSPSMAPDNKESHGLSSQQIAAIIGLGVGVVGLGFSAGYGISAVSKKNDAQSVCPGSLQCATAEGVSRWHDAEWAASASTLAFVIGCAGIIEAAVFWFTPSSKSTTTTQVGFGPGMLRVQGTW
jgi:hypothetical protein